MSHQTGIQANQHLKTFFGECKDGRIRAFKVIIIDEALTLQKSFESQKSWEDEYDEYVLNCIEHQQPCYIFYRLDSQNEAGYEWIFIFWSPDDSPVRQKMLYASTKATIKKEFGGGQIKDEVFGTRREEVRLLGYKKHIESESCPQPMSSSEAVLQQIRTYEAASGGIDVTHQAVQGVAFPISDDVINALIDLKDSHINYIQLSIDMEKEEINLEKAATLEVSSLCNHVPTDHARYHLFCLAHSYDGDYLNSTVFIYSVPGYNCPVKERMLYSSCKGPLLDVIENKIGIELAKKIEMDDDDELTEEFLIDQIHPKQTIYKPKFSKPKGPMNRGAKRLVKVQNAE
ncbi:twinfilin-2-like [Uloborus diversus]|uniref:twinfilin-2-like n=1 Tax=Uloborus diversus TaxID=327109 RepID=UPI00240A1920|nr:twinfilin-2-like [Uloborus diversus]